MNVDSKVYEEEIIDERMTAFCSQTHSFQEGFTRVHPYKCVLPKGYVKFEDKIKNTKILEDDVWIATLPKCGTRWIQEIIWLLKNNLDYEKANEVSLDVREPYFDMAVLDQKGAYGAKESFSWLDNTPSPRIVKTHLSYDMLPKKLFENKTKIVCLTRNPRDVCCSFFNHIGITDNYTGSFETMVDAFLADLVPYYGPYFIHTLSYWNRRELSNLLFLSYEEMHSDLPAAIKKIANFLEVTLSDADLPKLCEHVSFDSMKKNPTLNMEGFINSLKEKMDSKHQGSMINKGKTGNWKNLLTDDMVKRFEEWEAKWLEGSDLKLVYEV